MNNLNTSLLTTVLAVFASGCSDERTTANAFSVAEAKTSKVEKTISLKNLVIGMDIKSIKDAKLISSHNYMFNLDYFGKNRTFIASTNENGLIYKYQATLDGSIYYKVH